MNSIFLLFLSLAQAGFLKMANTSSLQLSEKKSGLVLAGTYTIFNQGDETARSVFPSFRLDRFQWSGEAQNLGAGEQFTWSLNQIIPLEQLCLSVSPECPVALPVHGHYLVKIHKHYQDLNGYAFEVPDILELNLNGKSQTPLNLRLQISTEDQKNFAASYNLKNPFEERISFAIQLHLPKEMRLESSIPPVEVPSEGELQGSFQFENVKGLPGSEYIRVLSAEWAYQGKRSGQWAYNAFKIQRKSPARHWSLDQTFWAWWSWSLFLGLILMWIFWIRPLRRLPK
ncbi:MAG: hypothetical protein ACAH59_08095 [Pseudobdellovibrionaceae bacterium]